MSFNILVTMAKKTLKKKKTKKKTKTRAKQVAVPKSYDHWETTEEALTQDLEEDLLDAWHKVREFAAGLGEQRIYASGKAIMFAKKVCYAFVRPKKAYLELVIFLPDETLRPGFKTVKAVSKTKYAHTFRLVHGDQVEDVVTDALSEAYAL